MVQASVQEVIRNSLLCVYVEGLRCMANVLLLRGKYGVLMKLPDRLIAGGGLLFHSYRGAEDLESNLYQPVK